MIPESLLSYKSFFFWHRLWNGWLEQFQNHFNLQQHWDSAMPANPIISYTISKKNIPPFFIQVFCFPLPKQPLLVISSFMLPFQICPYLPLIFLSTCQTVIIHSQEITPSKKNKKVISVSVQHANNSCRHLIKKPENLFNIDMVSKISLLSNKPWHLDRTTLHLLLIKKGFGFCKLMFCGEQLAAWLWNTILLAEEKG